MCDRVERLLMLSRLGLRVLLRPLAVPVISVKGRKGSAIWKMIGGITIPAQ